MVIEVITFSFHVVYSTIMQSSEQRSVFLIRQVDRSYVLFSYKNITHNFYQPYLFLIRKEYTEFGNFTYLLLDLMLRTLEI